ncbi:hypothetical protein PHYBLDRAFT_60786 [Phycomyces blakesleeanus NRRL 1555(-)]|uniref:Reverse transcriptase zinc-binding domain-containing protein n=1 Tax=Phycomyces blakesleeanus (strain ATCC 8743b / DSM 1359 / FGSC 10004 / NBRC 33097 / NRRL 1555) TaxID=763407 RepID=A0A167PCD8_PHYB8|nr:hypothetical protein PHYBLDRAFT_60786 [Phycomyces blakesleeanus NRRL 1555(-)]OAD77657.1 hypothetical protein PHYBLDRAFT_60786 [Phycomyces blakesleeanus NRRL 1555(-)]|eukprot:XP_018295697.1 hypothetical protein PHYBLDRAFT_60786 [Phycomyces blakesleeanus NRRL 1555(-)]
MLSTACMLCSSPVENSTHLFFFCPSKSRVWSIILARHAPELDAHCTGSCHCARNFARSLQLRLQRVPFTGQRGSGESFECGVTKSCKEDQVIPILTPDILFHF